VGSEHFSHFSLKLQKVGSLRKEFDIAAEAIATW
jgi:hypothetical protein